LPGTKTEKLDPWLAPFKDNLEFLLGENADDAAQKGAVPSKKKGEQYKQSYMMQDLFDSGKIEMEATTFLRGRSIPKCFFVIDEAQNLSLHEIKTILTRAGEGTKIVLLGDPAQIDNTYLNKFNNALVIAIEKFKDQKIAGSVTLTKGERSELATCAATIL
jgi:PhoH-like ATPase